MAFQTALVRETVDHHDVSVLSEVQQLLQIVSRYLSYLVNYTVDLEVRTAAVTGFFNKHVQECDVDDRFHKNVCSG